MYAESCANKWTSHEYEGSEWLNLLQAILENSNLLLNHLLIFLSRIYPPHFPTSFSDLCLDDRYLFVQFFICFLFLLHFTSKAVNCRHERGCIELNQNPAWANLDGATSMQNCEGGLSNYSFKVLKFAYLGLAAKSICFVKTQRAASVWSHGTLSSNTRYLAVVCQVISLALKQSLLMSSHIATFIQKYNGYLDRCFTVHWL